MDYSWIIIMVFISCLDSHSDGSHVMLKNKLDIIFDDLRVSKCSAIVHFWVNHSFDKRICCETNILTLF